MNHIGTQTLETESLILRRYTLEDAQEMFENWAYDADVTKFLRWQAHKSVEESRNFINTDIGCYQDNDYYQWAIELKELHQIIGGISLMDVNENDEKGEVGYCLGKAFWGRGFMTEALRSVLQFAFEKVCFNRIEASHSVRNPASGRVMQKAGMLYEGSAEQFYKSQSGFENCKLYAFLKKDYEAGSNGNDRQI